MAFIIIATIVLFVLLIINEIITIIAYGGFVTKQESEIFMNLDESKLRLNIYDSDILNINPYIAIVNISIFSKYHINDLGLVFRWSKLHKQITHYFNVAKPEKKITEITYY
jgi:hypothetical protein